MNPKTTWRGLRSRTWATHTVVAGALLWALLAPAALWAKGVALVVGVGEYAGSPAHALAGPAHDATAVRDVLILRWGFAPSDVRVLVDRAATKAAILAELRALAQRSAAGDDVIVYLSGHGTSAVDANELMPLPHGSGAFLPHDFDLSSPERALATAIVGRTDALPLYQALEQGGRKVWVISDSCYSGNQVRSVASEALPARFIPVVLGASAQKLNDDASRINKAGPPPPWPYKNLSFLAAAAEGELARDIPPRALAAHPTIDGKPHGAMTDALLRVLQGQYGADYNADGQMSLIEVHRAVGEFMASRGYGHTPQRHPNVDEDELGQGTAPLLRSAGLGKVAAAAAPTEAPLQVFVGGPVSPSLAGILAATPGLAQVKEASQADVRIQLKGNNLTVQLASGDQLGSWPTGQTADTKQLQGLLAQLALDKRWHLLVQRLGKGLLAAEVVPATQGGNVRIGQSIHFVVRPENAATLLLFNIDAHGTVTKLYPANRRDLGALPAGKKQAIPGSEPSEQIRVQLPLGMDIQYAIAFYAQPAQLQNLVDPPKTVLDAQALALVEKMLTEQQGRFGFARTVFRTLP